MANYRITSDYGTFTVRKTVQADSFDEAFAASGITLDLEAAGWQVIDLEGEYHLIENLDTDELVRYET